MFDSLCDGCVHQVQEGLKHKLTLPECSTLTKALKNNVFPKESADEIVDVEPTGNFPGMFAEIMAGEWKHKAKISGHELAHGKSRHVPLEFAVQEEPQNLWTSQGAGGGGGVHGQVFSGHSGCVG